MSILLSTSPTYDVQSSLINPINVLFISSNTARHGVVVCSGLNKLSITRLYNYSNAIRVKMDPNISVRFYPTSTCSIHITCIHITCIHTYIHIHIHIHICIQTYFCAFVFACTYLIICMCPIYAQVQYLEKRFASFGFQSLAVLANLLQMEHTCKRIVTSGDDSSSSSSSSSDGVGGGNDSDDYGDCTDGDIKHRKNRTYLSKRYEKCTCTRYHENSCFSNTAKILPIVLEDQFVHIFGGDSSSSGGNDEDSLKELPNQDHPNIMHYHINNLLSINVKPKEEEPYIGSSNIFRLSFQNSPLVYTGDDSRDVRDDTVASGCVTSWYGMTQYNTCGYCAYILMYVVCSVLCAVCVLCRISSHYALFMCDVCTCKRYFESVDPKDPLEFLKILAQRMNNVHDPPSIPRQSPKRNTKVGASGGNSGAPREFTNGQRDGGNIDANEFNKAEGITDTNAAAEVESLNVEQPVPQLGNTGTLLQLPPRRSSSSVMSVKFDGGVVNVEMQNGKRKVRRASGTRMEREMRKLEEEREFEEANNERGNEGIGFTEEETPPPPSAPTTATKRPPPPRTTDTATGGGRIMPNPNIL